MGTGNKAFIQGNVFYQIDTPFLSDSSTGQTFTVSSGDLSTCGSRLGRACAAYVLVSSSNLSVSNESVLSSWPSGETGVEVQEASQLKASILGNAGVGKSSISSSKSTNE